LQKYYRESKKVNHASLSHLIYQVLQHYRAKEETQKTAHWCFVRATQSNCCSALVLLSHKPYHQKPQAERIDYKIYGVMQQRKHES